ncbi:DUF4384 domain-containing protein [Variovorax sp. PCZ-1]|uniref:DUF4384 domain-containing protein n=1 Tax=Variovorax sp. PCZ-1 TaxID=2835533 RepID=UPI001BD07D5B|nr:DUF4384 domain-containing protein [Variovorax sp. PCZ-1]MBS7807647.1 DUF4384 domain-containing protein [Variovorax sp. PCZ-1]
MRSLRLTLSAMALSLLSACAISPRDNTKFFDSIPTDNIPVTAPVRSISSFSDSLMCMDKMLRDYKVPQTLVTSKIIADSSGKVSVGMKDMVITALSVMSRTSGAFRFVDFEVDAIKQDTVQNLTNLMLNAGQMRLQKPQLYISGSIAFMDQNVSVSRMGGGISAKNWEAGYSRDFMGTVFGLELHLGDFATRTLVPGVESANQLVLGNAGHGFDVGGRIQKTGVQFNFSREISQGLGPAVRTLIELGLIELIGKWSRVPYWQCLSLDQTHPEFQAQMRAWWDDMSGDERIKLFQNALRSSSYFNGNADGKPSAALREALMKYQADKDIVVTGNMGYESYERLTKDYVSFDGAGKFVRVGWGPADKAKAVAKGGAAHVVMSQQVIDTFKPRHERSSINSTATFEPKISILLGNRDGEYTVGESMVYSFFVDRQSFVYCYYVDSQRKVAQVYPNPLQRMQPIKANAAIQVPDLNNPNTFTIEFDKPGRQEVGCFATDQEIITRLPPLLRGPALQPLAGVSSIDDMQRAFATALGANRFGMARTPWTIVRK